MNILYIGDIMGSPGIRTVERILPDLKKELGVDAVIAQAENVTEGRGLSVKDYEHLKTFGVDGFSGGNWSMYRPEIATVMSRKDAAVIRPANYPEGTAGKGIAYVRANGHLILMISLLGQIVGKDASKPVDNPLHIIDEILEEERDKPKDAIVVNFHGDFSSEKRMIGYYLDGRVTAVIGDHWHVPTADAMLLPEGTAHITDVGMCGALHSSLGVSLAATLPRWRDGIQTKNLLETSGPMQFNALLVSTKNGLATKVEHIQRLV